MSDDYLWDGSGEPDPEVAALEAQLSGLRLHAGVPTQPDQPRAPRWIPGLVLVAAAIALIVLGPRLVDPGGDAWVIEGERGGLAVGEWLEADGREVELQVADIGSMILEPGTRLQRVASGPDQHRLSLVSGRVHAKVLAPPRLLVVETPAADAVDLGCAYTLEVNEAGETVLWVTSGQVALEAPGRDVFVPAGALAIARPGSGPGTPLFTDAPAALVKAVRDMDLQSAGAGDALMDALAQVRIKDTLSLWHLLPTVAPDERRAIAHRIFELDPLLTRSEPSVLSVESVVSLNPEALKRLRSELEFQWY